MRLAVPITYNFRNLWIRKVSTTLTTLGIGLVVATFIIVLGMTHSLTTIYTSAGSPENMVLLRQGALAEANSGVVRESYNALHYLPEIKRNTQGDPLVSPELVTQVLMERKGNVHAANVGIRGVLPIAREVHDLVRITQGRFFQPGQNEIVVGKALGKRFKNMELGKSISFGKESWRVVGIFEARGSVLESEIWADLNALMNHFHRDYFSSINLKAESPAHISSLKHVIESDPRLNIHPFSEQEYYQSQAENVKAFQAMGLMVTYILAIGAVFGAMNTMYAAIAGRTKEIGTLRALGFSAQSVLTSFLIESVLLAMIGGAIGCLLALPFQGFSAGSVNFRSFTATEFQFNIPAQSFLQGFCFALVMGLVGGFFPARQAAKLGIVRALREI